MRIHIILKDSLLVRMYYGETVIVKYYQTLIPKHLVNEVLRNLHADFGRLSGIIQTEIAYRQKHYYPNMAQLIRNWAIS